MLQDGEVSTFGIWTAVVHAWLPVNINTGVCACHRAICLAVTCWPAVTHTLLPTPNTNNYIEYNIPQQRLDAIPLPVSATAYL